MTDRPPASARTRPPLSGTPGGVTSFQPALPAGRTNSCQKLLCVAAEPPITTTAQVPAAVTMEVVMKAAPAAAASGAGPPCAGLPALPQPASAASARASAAEPQRA